jgi:ADP-ribosylglycohydrolase
MYQLGESNADQSGAEVLRPIDRIQGCLMVGAVGGALGYRVEFDKMASIRRKFGSAGVTLPIGELGKAVVSDDTQMTIYTAEGLIRAKLRWHNHGMCHIPTVVYYAYVRWLATQGQKVPGAPWEMIRDSWLLEQPVLRARQAPGIRAFRLLRAAKWGPSKNPSTTAKAVAPSCEWLRSASLAQTTPLCSVARQPLSLTGTQPESSLRERSPSSSPSCSRVRVSKGPSSEPWITSQIPRCLVG